MIHQKPFGNSGKVKSNSTFFNRQNKDLLDDLLDDSHQKANLYIQATPFGDCHHLAI